MKRLFVGAMVAALCGVPVTSRAETPSAPWEVAAPAPRDAQAGPASPGTSESSDDDASDYAAREAATPQLAEFEGGADGVYIGTGALIVALVIALLIVAL